MKRRALRWALLALPVLGFAGVLRWQASWRPRALTTLKDREVSWVAFTPDGKRLAAMSRNLVGVELSLWRIKDGGLLWRRGGDIGLGGSQVLPDGRIVTFGEFMRFWSVDGQLLEAHRSDGHGVALFGNNLIEDSNEGPRWKKLKRGSGQTSELWQLSPESQCYTIAFSPDGKTLACNAVKETPVGKSPFVELWNVDTGARKRKLPWYSEDIGGLSFSPDGRSLAVSGSVHAVVWNVEDGKVLRRWVFDSSLPSLHYSPDGEILAERGGGSVKLWDAKTGVLRRTLKLEKGDVYAFAFSPDSSTLAVGDDAGAITLWRIK